MALASPSCRRLSSHSIREFCNNQHYNQSNRCGPQVSLLITSYNTVLYSLFIHNTYQILASSILPRVAYLLIKTYTQILPCLPHFPRLPLRGHRWLFGIEE